MMGGRRKLMWTLMLLFVGGVFSNKCVLEYSQQLTCAVRGSPVVFVCFLNNIQRQEVSRFVWGHVKSFTFHLILNQSASTSERFEYIGDRKRNCSMKIYKVEQYDAGKYLFRYYYNRGCLSKHQFLKVKDLSILVQNANGETIKEGDSVNLTCINGCDGENSSSAFTWFKDGEAINEGPVLHLPKVSTKHSGNYTCSLKLQKGTTSPVAYVDVEYGLKNTSMLIQAGSEAEANSSILLICCSDAHPPVQDYIWFKMVDGQILKVGQQAEMLAVPGGQYFCSVSNKHGSQNSTVFTLKGKSYWTTFMRDVLVIVIVAVLLVVTIVAACRQMKNKTGAPETEHQEEIQVVLFGSNQMTEPENQLVWEDSHQPRTVIYLNVEEATTEVTYATIDFKKNRQPNREKQNYQKATVIYSTVCRETLLKRSNRASS